MNHSEKTDNIQSNHTESILSAHYASLARSSADKLLYKRYVEGLDAESASQLERMIQGQELPQIHADIIAKRIFHPDLHPRRLETLIRGITKDASIEIDGSFANEGIVEASDGKKVIFDLPARMSDGRAAIVEVQVVAQEYLPERTEIYSANALTRQYMVGKDTKKTGFDFRDVKDIYVIVLMVKSPHIFRDFVSEHYIHTALKNTTDTGIVFHALQHNIFIQLDKCLEQLIQGKDGEKNPNLQLFLAAIADINNDTVSRLSKDHVMLNDIRKELYELSQDKEVQIRMLEVKFAEADFAAALSESMKDGIREGEAIGMKKGEAIGLEKGEAIGLEKGEAIGLEKGEAIGLEKGEAIGFEKGEAIGLEKGEAIGLEKGETIGLLKQICLKLKKQKSIDQIAEALETELQLIERICEIAGKYAPEYDIQAIYTELYQLPKE